MLQVMEMLKSFLFIASALCILEFSVEENAPRGTFEVEHLQLQSGESREDSKEELLSAVHNYDTVKALILVRGGALEGYYHGIYTDSEETNLEKIRTKLKIVPILLKYGMATIPSPDYINGNSSEEGLFNVTLIPGTELYMTLLVNVSVIKNWTNETLIKSGKIPLFIICALPDVSRDIVKLVLDFGAVDVDVQNENNLTALMIAAEGGNLDIVKFLVEMGANVNNNAFMEIDYTNRFGLHYEYLKVFSNKKVIVGPTIIHSSALVAAVHEDHLDVVKYLLKNGAEVKVQSWVTLSKPASFGKIDMMEILLKNGIDPNSKDLMGATPLHKVAEKGNIDMAKLLIKYGAEANITDNFGWTPLHVAALFSRKATKAMIELLLESGCDVNQTTDGGFSPLNLAEAGNNIRFLKYLVGKYDELHATIEHKGLEETDSDESHADVIKLLLSKGAYINHQDNILGWTTLHWATASGDLRVTKLLVEDYGAVMTSSKMGLTPFGTAKYFGRKGVFEYFNTARNLV